MREAEPDALADLYDAGKRGAWGPLLALFEVVPALAAKAARYARGGSGWTLLHQAAYFGHEEAATRLVAAGAPVARASTEGETAAAVARTRGHGALATRLEHAAETGDALWRPRASPQLLPSSSAWKEATRRRAPRDLRIGYASGIVRIAKGETHYVDSFGRTLVGWHGTYDPPCGMGGEPIIELETTG
ncbi:MAG: ankyrin repeat domain-containing protein [Myxococcota bacterium]